MICCSESGENVPESFKISVFNFFVENGIAPAQTIRTPRSITRRLMPKSTIRKFLCGVSVAGLLILGISSRAHANPSKVGQRQSEKQTQQPTKSAAGKGAAIG